MKSINIEKFLSMMDGGTRSIAAEYKYINELNVFPVPDGDTGTNMMMTTTDTLNSINEKKDGFSNLKEFADLYSNKIIFNARGNSGVIFSQIISGFLSTFKDNQTEINVEDLIQCFQKAKEFGYNSVYNPIEGTVLTVIRYIFEFLDENKEFSSIKELFQKVIEVGEKALEATKEILEELKRLNVVDSGGYGLLSFLKGMNASLNDSLEEYLNKIKVNVNDTTQTDSAFNKNMDHEEIEFGYCSEFILEIDGSIDPNKPNLKKDFNFDSFRKNLAKFGSSIVAVKQNNLVKIHIHTTKPGNVLNFGQKYGEFVTTKIDNMTCQFMEKMKDKVIDINKLKNQVELIYTVPNQSLACWFDSSFGQHNFIVSENGTPTVENFLNKIKLCNSRYIICVVHDSNLLLALQKAIEEVKDKIEIKVISVNNILDSYSLIENFDQNASLKQNVKKMEENLKTLSSAVITTSVVDLDLDGINVNKGDRILLHNKKVVASEDNFQKIVDKAINLLKTNRNPDICYLIGGKNITLNSLENLSEIILEKFGIFCEVIMGGQESHDLVIGVK